MSASQGQLSPSSIAPHPPQEDYSSHSPFCTTLDLLGFGSQMVRHKLSASGVLYNLQLASWLRWLLSCLSFLLYICYSDRLCGLVVRVPGYRAEMYCASCEVLTEFIYVM
jgi:hypothetical protein